MPIPTPSSFLILALTALPVAAQAPVDPATPGEATRTPGGEPWRGTLQSGAAIRVDPRTNRPLVEEPGYERQLWDGVYRLDDGTELRVRNGRVVPTAEMLERRQATPPPRRSGAPAAPPPAARSGRRPCQRLMEQACGADAACAGTNKCRAARQLVDMAAEQRAQQADPNAMSGTGRKCREALGDSFFAPCRAAATGSQTAPANPR